MSNTVKTPGKFEGEHVSVEHFWNQTLDGCTDEIFVSDVQYSFVVVDADDRAKFPDVTEYGLMLWERSDGFVCTEWFATKEEYDARKSQLESESEDESEDEKFSELDEIDATDNCFVCGKPLANTSWGEYTRDISSMTIAQFQISRAENNRQ